MSNSAINTQVAQLKIGNVQNQADNSAVYSGGVWSLKNSTALTSVTITDAGNVGIGTGAQTPTVRLDVRGASNPSIKVWSGGGSIGNYAELMLHSYNSFSGVGQTYIRALSTAAGNSGTALTFATEDNGFGGPVERMRIDASGALRVGNTSGGGGANGVVHALGYATRSGGSGSFSTNSFNIFWTSVAQLWIDSTNVGTIAFSSDYRIKKNIETQELPALERIAQLRPVKYEFTDYKELFKADGVQREGFIAHELQAVIPSAVEGEKDAEGQIQSLKLDALCAVMVKAIQEQQAQIEALKAEVAALKAP